MGGIWERQIRTTRSVLSSILQEHGKQLDDEALRTLMTEAESIINCRPLTVENLTDPPASEPLTPNHLLTLKTQIVLPPPGKFNPWTYILTRNGTESTTLPTNSGCAGKGNTVPYFKAARKGILFPTSKPPEMDHPQKMHEAWRRRSTL